MRSARGDSPTLSPREAGPREAKLGLTERPGPVPARPELQWSSMWRQCLTFTLILARAQLSSPPWESPEPLSLHQHLWLCPWLCCPPLQLFLSLLKLDFSAAPE